MEEVLFLKKSKFQRIMLTRDEGITTLWLDRYFQFDTDSERMYHESLVSIPLAMSREAKTVLIMGGGDGLAIREALRFPVKRIVWIELDPAMVLLARSEFLTPLNENSTRNPKVKILLGDARQRLSDLPDQTFDVVVADFPAATSKELEELIAFPFIDRMLAKMKDGGVFATQVSESLEYQRRLRDYLKDRLGHSASFFMISQDTIGSIRRRGIDLTTDVHRFTYGSSLPFSLRRRIPTNGPIGRSDRQVISLLSLFPVASFKER